MISVDYINNGRNVSESELINNSFSLYLESCLVDTDNAFDALNMMKVKADINSIMTEGTDDSEKIYQEATSDFVKKIGDKIIEIYEKFAAFVKNMIEKLKGIGFKGKSDLQKVDLLCKKHPDLKDQVIMSYKAGELDLSDARSLKDLDDTFNEIVKLSKKANENPKSLRARWDRAMEKFDKNESKTIKAVVGVGAVVTAIVAIRTYRAKIEDAKASYQKSDATLKELKATIHDSLISNPNSGITNDTGKYQTMLAIYRELVGKHQEAIGHNQSVINKMSNAISKFADKVSEKDFVTNITGDKKDSYHSNMNHTLQNARYLRAKDVGDKKTAENLANLQFNKTHAAELNDIDHNKAYTQHLANLNFNQTHAAELDDIDYNKAYTQHLANLNFNQTHAAELDDIDYNKAYTQQLAKNDALPPKGKDKPNK